MIRTSQVDPETFSGWLADYVKVGSRTRFPVSFQALSGVFALSSIVGRKCGLRRSGYTLWPPTSILLLGHSGVGKSASLMIARSVVEAGVDGVDRPEFLINHAFEQTTSGLHARWAQHQADRGLGFLEGISTANELKSILARRTGTENASQFLIEACEHKNLTTFTLGRGECTVKNMTIAFGFCSPVHYLRSAVSIDDFGGGLMHRFLIAHETQKQEVEEGEVRGEDVMSLALRARSLWEDAPLYAEVDPAAENRLNAIRNSSEHRKYSSVHLSGFWNRYDAIVAKVGLIFAISDGEFRVKVEHVDRAELFLRRSLYPPVEELVQELSHGPRERALYDIGDDLYMAGDDGLPISEVLRRLPGTSMRSKNEALELMKTLGIAVVVNGRVIHAKGGGDG